MPRQITLLVGTTKGAFFFHSDESRREWRMTGPHLGGWEIYSLLGDPAGERVYVGTSHWVYGATIRVSDDLGETWEQVENGPAYSPESGFKLERIWQLAPGHPSEPGTLYAGVEEAGLFVSRDGGTSWSELSGLTSHQSRPYWFPGGGGLCLHTILPHPENPRRVWVGISAVGVFRTDDGGETWQTRNQGLEMVPTGQPEIEVGRCVHKMVVDRRNPDTLYMQFHGGVYRSDDAGDHWRRIESGLPGNFGFPMAISADGALYVVPLESNEKRFAEDGRLRVYRSRDGGESWAPTAEALIDGPEFVGVLRDAMAADSLDPAGIYLGTTIGEVFVSADGGDRWERLPARLPRITTVKVWERG